MLLRGKTVLLTGGSRGIGKAVVLEFLKNGASVYYAGLHEGDAVNEYREIAEKTGTKVLFRECNVTDEEAVTAVTEEILKTDRIIIGK